MIVNKNENTYLKYAARCLAHKCSIAAIIGNHVSYTSRPLPLLLPRGNVQGKQMCSVSPILPPPPIFLILPHFPSTLLFQFAGLVPPVSSLPWLCEEDPHHWLYLLADHNYLSVPDLSGTQNI